MREKRILVTGASRGIGKATAFALLEAGHQVILHARSRESLAPAYAEATGRFGARAAEEIADLSDLAQVESMCRRLEADGRGLDVLVNNAGMVTHELGYSAQGIEIQFAVNHLAGFYLANRLLPLLAAATSKPASATGDQATDGLRAPGRILQVSSIAHGFIKEVDFAVSEVGNLATKRTDPYDHRYHYYRSKLANVLFVTEWARRIPSAHVTANALHPGIVRTRLSKAYMKNPVFRFFEAMIATTPEKACATSVHLAGDDSVEGITGAFFKASEGAPIKGLGTDEALAGQLWETSLSCLPSEMREQLAQARATYKRTTGASDEGKGAGNA
jgi:retinol dehydrogenase 14